MRDVGREEMKGENRRGTKLLIDFEGEEKVEENEGMKEACWWECKGAVKKERR